MRAGTAFVAVSIALLPLFALLRLYEFLIVRSAHVLPDGALASVIGGFRVDVALTLWLAALLLAPILLLSLWKPRVGTTVHRVVIVLVVIGAVALAQYFAVTFVPLGADLFAYSWKDIRETTASSKGTGLLAFVPFIIAGALAWFVTGRALRVSLPRGVVIGFAVAVALSLVVPRVFVASPANYASDASYFLADSKTVYFWKRAFNRFAPGASGESGQALAGFPLMRPAFAPNVLGPLLNASAEKPNIVFVIVEGLGRDFVGPGAHHGGFTPFLDSLAARSLYWENFLSTSGRTFGVLPSMLGSLPPISGGFMELGTRMPQHVTLASLLKERGYTTSYFTGTDGHFDMIDLFMDRQAVDSFIDVNRFGAGYEKQPASEGGVSWGYGDAELFRRSLASRTSGGGAKLDVYLTITTHEPFIPPRVSEYAERFQRRLASLAQEAKLRDEYLRYANVFQTLLYTDDALRQFLAAYAARPEYARTIFIITGDHRLIPIPPGARIDRYRVPFIIHSPLVKAPRRFASVSSHLDVAPSLMALLRDSYGVSFPDSLPFVGTGIDTSTAFRNTHAIALARTKSETDEFLDGAQFLSGEQLFSVTPALGLEPLQDDARRSALREKLARATALSRFIATGEHIYPRAVNSTDAREAARDDSAFAALGLAGQTPEALLLVARTVATAGDHERARLILRKLLRDIPNYHDARALLGRSYAWQRRFDEARPILRELLRRAPEYVDGYVALVNVEIWAGRGNDALSLVDAALRKFPGSAELRDERVKALDLIRAKGP